LFFRCSLRRKSYPFSQMCFCNKCYMQTFEIPSTRSDRSPCLYPTGTGRSSYAPRYWVPFSSPPTSRRATVDVFELASTWGTRPAGLGPSLYSLEAGPTENTTSSSPIVVMGGCLAIARTSFPRKRVNEPLLRNGRLFICLLYSNGCTRLLRGLCLATGSCATVF
jgi:hypothetical protein